MDSPVLKKFASDQVIFREGDPGDEMYIVHTGKVKMVKQIQRKFETLDIMGQGDFFGEMSLVNPDTPRHATAISASDQTEVVTVKKDQFEKMLATNPEIAMRMIRQYAKRLIEANARLEKVLGEQQMLDSGIQDILTHVRRQSEPEVDSRAMFGWLMSNDQQHRLPLKRPEVLIGRRDEVTKMVPDVDLTDLDQYRTVSRRHARISCYDDGYFLCEEMGVINGTLLNGNQIEQGKLTRINDQDRLQFGKLEFTFLIMRS